MPKPGTFTIICDACNHEGNAKDFITAGVGGGCDIYAASYVEIDCPQCHAHDNTVW